MSLVFVSGCSRWDLDITTFLDEEEMNAQITICYTAASACWRNLVLHNGEAVLVCLSTCLFLGPTGGGAGFKNFQGSQIQRI